MYRTFVKLILVSCLGLNALMIISCRNETQSPGFRNTNNSEKHIDSLLDLAEKNPDNIAILNQIADYALQSMDTGLAIYFLKESLSVAPLQSEVTFTLAGILQSQKNPEWLRLVEQLIKSDDPIACSKGYFLMGIDLTNQDKLNEAVAAFDKSISLNFSFTDPYIEKAIILLEKNKIADASDLLYAALDLDRKSPDIHFLIGECWMKKKMPERAVPFYEETLKLDPDFVSAQKRIDEIKP